jgi:rsbT co-antagonist protein RsbR
MTVDASPMDDSHVVVAFNDVRALREAHDQEIRRARALYSAILDAVPAVMFVKAAADRRYIHANTSWAKLTRMRPEDAIGKTVFDLYPAALAAAVDEGDAATLAAGEVVALEETVVTATGEIRSIFTTKTPILDDDGTPVLLVGVTQDITDQKQAEETLRKSREELDETRRNLLETIRELSTPVLPIHDGVLVVPLVGHMDSQRCGQLTEAILAGIQRHRASAVILDVTGVEVIDTAVANHLMQATRAAALLGASCVIVGIAPQVARTLVQIGVDFGEITTRRDLQAGVAYALDQEGAR